MAGMRNQIWLIPVALAVTAILGAGCTSGTPVESDAGNASEQAAGGPVTASSLNGTYRYEITLDEATKLDMVDPEDTYPQVDTVILTDGELEGGCFGASGGTYTVDGDQVTFHSIDHDSDATVTVSVDDDGNLHLTPDQAVERGDAFQCFSQVWMKIA